MFKVKRTFFLHRVICKLLNMKAVWFDTDNVKKPRYLGVSVLNRYVFLYYKGSIVCRKKNKLKMCEEVVSPTYLRDIQMDDYITRYTHDDYQ